MRAPRYFTMVVLGIALALVVGCGKNDELTVKRLSRSSAPAGEYITIFGSGFQSGGARGVRIYFGNHQAKKVYIEGNDKLKVEVPGAIDATGKTVDIKIIFEPGGEITYPNAFKYVPPVQTTVDDLIPDQK